LLDEFLEQGSEKAVTDPLKRAFFQRDPLATYDWLSLPRDEHTEGLSDLQKRVTEIIRESKVVWHPIHITTNNSVVYDVLPEACKRATNRSMSSRDV
jgi:hypothetical protein